MGHGGPGRAGGDLGFTCGGGLAARADRLVIVLVGAFLGGLGVPYVLEAAMALLAVTSMITVFQRIEQVRRQAKGPKGSTASGAPHGQPV